MMLDLGEGIAEIFGEWAAPQDTRIDARLFGERLRRARVRADYAAEQRRTDKLYRVRGRAPAALPREHACEACGARFAAAQSLYPHGMHCKGAR